MLSHNIAPDGAPHDRPHWAADLTAGHVLAFTIPTRGRRRPDPEPHLVLGIVALDYEPAAVLAPGVPATGRRARREDVYATADDLAAVRGLHGPHQFLTARRLVVSLTHHGLIEAAQDGTPLLGLLAPPALRRVHRARARLDVERAMAQHRLRARYFAGRDAVRDRDFTVVPRHLGHLAPCAVAPRPARGGEGSR